MKDDTARAVMNFLEVETDVSEIKDEDLPTRLIESEFRKLVAHGKCIKFPDSQTLLARRSSKEPKEGEARNHGLLERLVGEEPLRTYVPMLLRPRVMDRAHEEAIHLGEKVTLAVSQRIYW